MKVGINKHFYKGNPEKIDKWLKKEFGESIANTLKRRLRQAEAVENLAEISKQGYPGNWHWLKGDMEGCISVDVNANNRAIFQPEQPYKEYIKPDGSPDDALVESIILMSIEDTHN